MKLLREGQLTIIEKLKDLKSGWDGYSALPIKRGVIRKFSDMSYIMEIVTDFRKIGFIEEDIDVVPTPKGTIQFEAQKNGRYFEVEID